MCPPSRLSISVEYQARQQYLSRWFIWIITDFVYKQHCSGHHTIPLSADRKCTRNAGESAPLLCRSFPNGIRVSFHPCLPDLKSSPSHHRPLPFLGSLGLLQRSRAHAAGTAEGHDCARRHFLSGLLHPHVLADPRPSHRDASAVPVQHY